MKKISIWSDDTRSVCQRIEASKGILKIVLKTKDDPYFLRNWINHHSKIVGIHNLIVFDNMSTDREVLKIYDEFMPDLLVVQYDGFHNYIHCIEMFPHLYTSLRNSSKYFSFLDTDEFLSRIDRLGMVDSSMVVPSLEGATQSALVFPCAWLYNYPGSDSVFRVGPREEIVDCLRKGKPILSSSYRWGGIINHNFEVPRDFYNLNSDTNNVILHMANRDRNQRIRANIRKLVAREAISSAWTVEQIIALDVSSASDGNIRLYVEEIRNLLSIDNVYSDNLDHGFVRIVENEAVVFADDTTKSILMDLLANSSKSLKRDAFSLE